MVVAVARPRPGVRQHLQETPDGLVGDILAGALTDPPGRALLVFRTAERSAVEAFARDDPYVRGGLVTRWEVRPWAVVIGADTADAIPPGGAP